ncbi:DUF1641 domain-containing protein [Kaistella jeonii]|uniref:Uncharacterized protein n=1 Tax=Kaistella jeonii TaxID=266749 RepID=A0A0C1CU42_9FLAO|nr:DUF1641 domain-containing protein [Kaistella jeonii]KIA84745.1 hypothetical protein OA86_14845 [Kaistella jeonii]SFC43495.1 Uncharacterized conserved protein YjgD, DUF1641 family [Kaistella jeonii]VEI96787.1 Uncharacterised protein [Kaistella jeonii]
MSIIRVTEGENITNIEKGWTVFTDTFDAYAGQFSHFTATNGTVFGNPKSDKSEETHYFKEGWWSSDSQGNSRITEAAIGQVVYFQVKTKNITDPNADVGMQLYDEDGGLGGEDDPIGVREVTQDDSLGALVTEKRVTNNAIVYNLTLSDGLASFIEDDFGDEIELYFECSYKEDINVKLPLSSELYLKVEICDKNVVQSFNNKQYGSCDFYCFRYDDFMRRHKHCGHMPPVYYFGEMRELSSWSVIDNITEWWTPSLTNEMKQISISVEEVEKQGNKYKPVPSTSYGFKYCTRFSRVLMPTLTQRGQIWLTEARFKLQKYMEQGVIDKTYIANYDVIILDSLENNFNDNFKKFNWSSMIYEFDQEMQTKYYTNIEIDNDKFQDFAFATHPDAYDPVKMSYLSADDLLKVMSTPDMKEWLGSATWAQALIMARNLNYREITEATLNRFFKKYILGDDGFK